MTIPNPLEPQPGNESTGAAEVKATTPVGAANPEKVSHFLDYLRKAYEHYLNVQQDLVGEPVEYIDAFMTVHNFHRMVVDDLIKRTGNDNLAQAAVTTFEIGMLHRDQAVSVPFTFTDDDDFDEDDFDEDDEPEDLAEDIDLGPCCACEKTGPDVKNIIMLPKKAPVSGTGWGCFTCGLPMDGAAAVLCDDCLPQGIHVIRFVINGRPAEHKRTPIEDLSDEPFEHDMTLHPDEDYPEVAQ